MINHFADPKKAIIAGVNKIVDKKIAANSPKVGTVLSINPDGTLVVDDGQGGCSVTIPQQNAKVGDTVKLGTQLLLGQQTTLPPIYTAGAPSTRACPVAVVCDLSPGGEAPDVPVVTLTVETHDLRLDWPAVDCAKTYDVERATGDCTSNTGFTVLASGVTDNFYVDSTVTPGTTYAYRVSSVGANESESEPSVCVSGEVVVVLVPTLFATFGNAWDLTTGALSGASHPPALSDAYGYLTLATGGHNDFYVGQTSGYNTLKIGDDLGTSGFQGYGSANSPAGTAGGRYQLGKGPSSGIVAGLEFVMPLVLESPNSVAGQYQIVLTLRNATTLALIAQNSLADVISDMQANDGSGQMFDLGGPRAHIESWVPKAGIIPDPDGSFWLITNAARIYKRSGVDGSAISQLDLASGGAGSFGTDPPQIVLV